MTLSRGRTTLGALGLAAAGLLAVSACGSNNNTSSSPSSSAAGATGSASSSAGAISCASGTLTSSGSTAQANAVEAWTKAYQTACSGATINYGGGGSGQGYTDFTAGTDDFAGSDYALSSTQKPDADKRCSAGGGTAVDLPMTPGAIAIGYNLTGVSNLKLSATTLAKIFSGAVTKWNDPTIAADNPGVSLPSTKITTFSRSDTSGTSFNFSNYLSNDAPSVWTYGANKQFPGKGTQGEKGSALVASSVKSTDGGIGYFELSYATTDNIPTASIGDAAGNFIAPSAAATTAFLSKAKVVGTGGDLALSFDYTKADASASSYPNSLVTYEFVCTAGNKNAALLKSFLTYTSGAGQDILQANGYVPLPSAIQTQVQAEVAKLS